MDNALMVAVIIAIIVMVFILWRWLKPYLIKYDTTIFITGELGSGKTLHAVKIGITELRKARIKAYWKNKIINIKNKKRKKYNERQDKLFKNGKIEKVEYKAIIDKIRKPQIFSNMPIFFKPHAWSGKREAARVLTKEMLTLYDRIPEYSIVIIDELPLLVNQYNWDIPAVQNNINELITLFRHYVGGKLIITAQASNDVVVQIRRKCNQAIWCYHMKKYIFFYSVEMADMMLNDNIQSMSTTFIEENTRKHWGFFPSRKTYNSRYLSERYKNTLMNTKRFEKWEKLKTNKIIRMEKYQSPLDDETTKEQKEKQLKEIMKL